MHWHQVPPAKSLFFSFVACFTNFGALTVFGLVWVGVCMAAGVVLSLVASLLVAVGALGAGDGASRRAVAR